MDSSNQSELKLSSLTLAELEESYLRLTTRRLSDGDLIALWGARHVRWRAETRMVLPSGVTINPWDLLWK